MAKGSHRLLSFLNDIHAFEETGGTFWDDAKDDEGLGPTRAIMENSAAFALCANEVAHLLEKDARLIADPAILEGLVRVVVHNPAALTEEYGAGARDFAQILRSYVYLEDSDSERAARANHLLDLFLCQRRPASDLIVLEHAFANPSLTQIAPDPSLGFLLGAMNAVFFRGERLACSAPDKLQDDVKRQALPLYWLQTDERGLPSQKLMDLSVMMGLLRKAEATDRRSAHEISALAHGLDWVQHLPVPNPATRAFGKARAGGSPSCDFAA